MKEQESTKMEFLLTLKNENRHLHDGQSRSY